MRNGRALAWFLGLSFIPTWVYFGVAPLYGIDMVNPLAQLPFAFMPAIAAILVRAFVTREGFADAGMRLRLKASWGYYLLAWFVPLAMAVATVATAWAFGLVSPGRFVPDGGLPLIAGLHVLVVVLMPVFWGEEFGWTSYLRLRLFPDRPIASTLGTGLIWAIWHWPLAFNGYIEFDNAVIGLAVWTPLMMTQEVMLAWLRMRSGSIWPTSLAHAGNNMILSWLTASVLQEGAGIDPVTVMLVMLVPMTLLSAWIILSGRLRDALTARNPASRDSSASSLPEPAAPRR